MSITEDLRTGERKLCAVSLLNVYIHRGRRYLGKIKGVELEFLRLFKGHDLDVEGPGWVVSIGNGIEEVSDGIVRVAGGQALCLLHGQILDSLISL